MVSIERENKKEILLRNEINEHEDKEKSEEVLVLTSEVVPIADKIIRKKPQKKIEIFDFSFQILGHFLLL